MPMGWAYMRRNRLTRTAFQYGAGAARGTRRTVKSARSTTRNRSSRQSRDPPPLTGEHDYRNVYRKKRMPWRKKKKWINFKKKVNAVIDKRVGTHANLITRSSIRAAVAGTQTNVTVHTVLDRFDFEELRDRVAAISPGTSISIPGNTMRYVISGTFVESTHTNTSSNVIFVDLYYWRTKRDVPTAEFANFEALITSTTGSSPNWAGGPAGSPLVPSDLGWTPFVSVAAHRFLEIYNKRRVKVNPGGVFQVTQRSSRNIYVKNDVFMDQKSLVRGMTHGVYMVVYGAPTAGVPPGSQASASELASTVHKTFYWKVIQNNYDTRGEWRQQTVS